MSSFSGIFCLFIAFAGYAARKDGLAFATTCVPRSYGHSSSVCVCDSRQCGALQDGSPQAPPLGSFALYTTSRSGLRLHRSVANFTNGYPPRGVDRASGASLLDRIRLIWSGSEGGGGQLSVDAFSTYQNIQGFGAAITDSAAINIHSMSEAARDTLMNALFSEKGNGYTLLRVPIGGTDDSTRKYSYADVPGDLNLTSFRLAEEDRRYKIPLLRNASQMTGGQLRLVGSAWSAPPWMKNNNNFVSGILKREYYQLWADYHIRFLEEYAAEGVPIWAITTGNEPINGFAPLLIHFNSMGWTPGTQREWVGRYLGPTLRSSPHNQTLLLALDDQRMLLPWWIDLMLRDNYAGRFIDGIAVHWYWDLVDPSAGLETTHQRFPDLFILSTEASSADKPWQLDKVRLGSWSRAEKYMKDIITDMKNWVTGWMEWSLALDLRGGPTWSGNFVDVGVIVDPDRDEILFQPTYFAMAHFSRFVPPGSTRIRLQQNFAQGQNMVDRGAAGQVDAVAFCNPKNEIVVVMHNRGESDASVTVRDPRVGVAAVVLPAKSFNTILYVGEESEFERET